MSKVHSVFNWISTNCFFFKQLLFSKDTQPQISLHSSHLKFSKKFSLSLDPTPHFSRYENIVQWSAGFTRVFQTSIFLYLYNSFQIYATRHLHFQILSFSTNKRFEISGQSIELQSTAVPELQFNLKKFTHDVIILEYFKTISASVRNKFKVATTLPTSFSDFQTQTSQRLCYSSNRHELIYLVSQLGSPA